MAYPIRRQLKRLRNPYVLSTALDIIDHEVDQEGQRRGLPIPLSDLDRWNLLEALGSRRGYPRHVRKIVDQVARDAHVQRVWTGGDLGTPEGFPSVSFPTEGPWRVEADMGFGTSTTLGAAPEEMVLGLVQQALLREDADSDNYLDDYEFGEPGVPMEVLAVGTEPSIVTRCFDALFPHPLWCPSVTEVSPVEVERESDVLKARYPHVIPLLETDEARAFQLIIWLFAAPAAQGGQWHPSIYQPSWGQPGGSAGAPFDPARWGARSWRRWLRIVVGLLPQLITDEGEAHLYLPQGVRTRRGYEDAPELLRGLHNILGEAGLDVVRDLEVIEMGPSAQPFVARNRCPHRLVTVTKRGGRQ